MSNNRLSFKNQLLYKFDSFELSHLTDAKEQYEFSKYLHENNNYFDAIRLLKRSAEKGYANAQVELAKYYFAGLDINHSDDPVHKEFFERIRSVEEGVRLLKLASAQDSTEAQCMLAECYENSKGVEHNPKEAGRLWKLAAEKNAPEAQYALSKYYKCGIGDIPINAKEESRLLKLSAKQGYAPAEYDLGAYYHERYEENPNEQDAKNAISLLKSAAKKEYSDSEYILGHFYFLGAMGIEINHEEGIRLFHSASEKGHAVASYDLAKMYYHGNVIEKNINEAEKLLERAIQQGYKDPECIKLRDCIRQEKQLLHKLFEGNKSAEKKSDSYPANEHKYLEKKSDPTDSEAQYDLAKKYIDENNYKDGLRLMRLSAEKNYPKAQMHLGLIYMMNLPSLPADDKEAIRLLTLASEQGDLLEAQCILAKCYEQGTRVEKDDFKAARLWQLALKKGDPQAQCALSQYYKEGKGGIEINDKESLALLRESAKQHYAEAQYLLSQRLFDGDGVNKNEEEAVKLLKLASKSHAPAQFELAQLHFQGKYVAKNQNEFKKLLVLSANQGYTHAQFDLGHFYYKALNGFPQNFNEAKKYLVPASNKGVADASYDMGMLLYNETQNASVAKPYIDLAAQQGHPFAKSDFAKLELSSKLLQAVNKKLSHATESKQTPSTPSLAKDKSEPKKTLAARSALQIEEKSYNMLRNIYLDYKKMISSKSAYNPTIPSMKALKEKIADHEELLISFAKSSCKILQRKAPSKPIDAIPKIYENEFKNKAINAESQKRFNKIVDEYKKNEKSIIESHNTLEKLIQQYNEEFEQRGKNILQGHISKQQETEYNEEKQKWQQEYQYYLSNYNILDELVKKANENSTTTYPKPKSLNNDKIQQLDESDLTIISQNTITNLKARIATLKNIIANLEADIIKFEKIISRNASKEIEEKPNLSNKKKKKLSKSIKSKSIKKETSSKKTKSVLKEQIKVQIQDIKETKNIIKHPPTVTFEPYSPLDKAPADKELLTSSGSLSPKPQIKSPSVSFVSSTSIAVPTQQSFISSLKSPSNLSFVSSSTTTAQSFLSSSASLVLSPSPTIGKYQSGINSPQTVSKLGVFSQDKKTSTSHRRKKNNTLINEAKKQTIACCIKIYDAVLIQYNALLDIYKEQNKIPQDEIYALQFICRAILRDLVFARYLSWELRTAIAYHLSAFSGNDSYTVKDLFNAINAYLACLDPATGFIIKSKASVKDPLLTYYLGNSLHDIAKKSNNDVLINNDEKFKAEDNEAKFAATVWTKNPIEDSILNKVDLIREYANQKFENLTTDYGTKSRKLNFSQPVILKRDEEHHPGLRK